MVIGVAIIAGPLSLAKKSRLSGSDPPSPLISTEVWLASGSSPLGFPILQYRAAVPAGRAHFLDYYLLVCASKFS